MARFIFKLQSVLNFKKQVENNLKNQLGNALRKLEEEKEVLNNFEKEKKKYISEIGSKASTGVKIGLLRSYNSYISFIRQEILNQCERIKSVQEIVDKYREELIQAMKSRKILETLKEKQYEEYLREERKKEQKIIEEVINFKMSSQKNGGE